MPKIFDVDNWSVFITVSGSSGAMCCERGINVLIRKDPKKYAYQDILMRERIRQRFSTNSILI